MSYLRGRGEGRGGGYSNINVMDAFHLVGVGLTWGAKGGKPIFFTHTVTPGLGL